VDIQMKISVRFVIKIYLEFGMKWKNMRISNNSILGLTNKPLNITLDSANAKVWQIE